MAVLQLSIILYYDTLKILKSGLDRGPIIYDSNIKVDEYIKFALIFIELVDECAKFLEKVDRLSLEKWKVTDGELLYRESL